MSAPRVRLPCISLANLHLTCRYATGEFEVTEERLGCYLPTEHIDNPKDYNENKDARQVYPKLRPPVDPQELEIDPRTGMLVRSTITDTRLTLLMYVTGLSLDRTTSQTKTVTGTLLEHSSDEHSYNASTSADEHVEEVAAMLSMKPSDS